MAEHLSLLEIVEELRSLEQSHATGRFFIVSDEKYSASFSFDKGRLIAIQCRVRSGEQAIPLIARIKHGTCRFEESLGGVQEVELPENEYIFRAILATGEHMESNNEFAAFSSSSYKEKLPTQPISNIRNINLSNQQRQIIEEILINELGPMGSLVLDSIVVCKNLEQMTSVIKNQVDDNEIVKSLIPKIIGTLSKSA
jgi:hypothetical protein